MVYMERSQEKKKKRENCSKYQCNQTFNRTNKREHNNDDDKDSTTPIIPTVEYICICNNEEVIKSRRLVLDFE